jgi:hypothetical protein
MARYLYSELSSVIEARRNCAQRTETTQESDAGASVSWFNRHTDMIEALVKQHLPHGSGYDCGTKIDLDCSHADKLVFTTEFHHMNENGYYDGWTEHAVTVTPALHGDFHLRISGRNRNDIKEMMYQDFDYALRVDVTYDLLIERYPEFAFKSTWEKTADGQSTLVFLTSDGTRFTGADRNATGTYNGSPIERARAHAAKQMEAKMCAR